MQRTRVVSWLALEATVGAGEEFRSPAEFKQWVEARLGRVAEALPQREGVSVDKVAIESVKTWNPEALEYEPDSSSPSH